MQAWRFVGAIFFVLALYFSNLSPIKDDDGHDADIDAETGKKQMSPSTATSMTTLSST